MVWNNGEWVWDYTDGPLALTVHVSLLFVLNESIAARFAGFIIRHHVDLWVYVHMCAYGGVNVQITGI